MQSKSTFYSPRDINIVRASETVATSIDNKSINIFNVDTSSKEYSKMLDESRQSLINANSNERITFIEAPKIPSLKRHLLP